jgi:hypothetical protein
MKTFRIAATRTVVLAVGPISTQLPIFEIPAESEPAARIKALRLLLDATASTTVSLSIVEV